MPRGRVAGPRARLTGWCRPSRSVTYRSRGVDPDREDDQPAHGDDLEHRVAQHRVLGLAGHPPVNIDRVAQEPHDERGDRDGLPIDSVTGRDLERPQTVGRDRYGSCETPDEAEVRLGVELEGAT